MIIYYFASLLIQVGLYISLGLAFNLALGFTGIINLGHIAFFGIGAYTTIILYINLGVPVFLAIIIGGIAASFVSFFLMVACRKLKGDYLALATLSFHFVIYSLLLNLKGITNGTRGIIIKRPDFLANDLVFLGFVILFSGSIIIFMKKLVASPFGTLLGAVRDDEALLRSMGKNSQLLKIKALGISTFIAGMTGGIMALFLRYIYPDFFYINELVAILIIVIMGGIASIRGTIVASFIVVLLPEFLRFIDLPTAIIGPFRQILYSSALIIILIINSRGLFGKVDLH